MKKTFLNLEPQYCDPERSYFHIVPIPYAGPDSSSSVASGPDAILDASRDMGTVDEKSRRFLGRLGVYTLEPVPVEETLELELARIERFAREADLFRFGRVPIALGGARSISSALLRVAAERYPELGVLQMDSRLRLRDSDAFGVRALETTREIVCVGARAIFREELERFPDRVDAIVAPDEVEDCFETAVEKILLGLPKDVYLTFDMSALDPSVAPGVAAPEPGGLRWRRAVEIVRAVVSSKNLVGADVVGICPLGNGNVVSDRAAARLVGKIIDAVSSKKAF